jgi:hypothetical protein
LTCLTSISHFSDQISEISEVSHLQGLTKLSILWLCDNPCVGSSPADYRKRIIAMLPNITKLDNVDVSEEERAAACPPAEPAAPARGKPGPPRAAASAPLANGPTPSRNHPNVLSAVLLLLNELDTDALNVLRAEIDQRLRQ